MEKDKMTPEDKLLKIIENPSAAEKHFSFFKRKADHLKTKLNIQQLRKGKKILEAFKLRTINKILVGVCVGITVFWAVYFYYSRVKWVSRVAAVETVSADFNIFKESKAYLDVSLEESISQAKKRNVFSFTLPKEEKVEKGEEITERDVLKLIEGIKLVGIIWSKINPEVMIEDEQEEKTYLLSEGDQLGVITIKKIYKNRVMIDVEGSELELR
ncbi:MAG: hypothetical protein JSV34_00060 [Candidatus Omnitrophota bacterium]|nr:MAG: hypothetical protein JSV34_00060 [Candidatus Omnitrophota bacterium]